MTYQLVSMALVLLGIASSSKLSIALSTLSTAGLSKEPASWFAMQALRTVLALVTGDPVVDAEKTEPVREAHQREKMARIAALSPQQFPALTAHAEAMAYCSDVDMFIDLGATQEDHTEVCFSPLVYLPTHKP